MAGWISSKLKVAETFLQQIDQQAAESLGNNEKSRSDTLNGEFQTKLESLPLKDQLKKSNNDVYSNLSTVSDSERKTAKKKLEATVTKPSPSHSRVLAEGDWTELLSSPKPISTTERSNGISALRATKDTKKNSLLISNSTPLEVKKSHKSSSRVPKSSRRLEIENVNGGISVSSKQSHGSDVSNFVQKKPVRHSQSDKGSTGAGENDSIATFSNSKNDKSGDSTMLETAASVDSEVGKESHSEINGKKIGLVEGSLQVQGPGPDLLVVSEPVMSSGVAEMMGRADCDESVDISRSDESDLHLTGSVLHVVQGSSGESKGPTTCKLDSTNASSSESDESSDSAIDSGSASDSEEENRRREEKRKRREQIIAEKAAAKAAEAIRERENIVARLEGEKQSLEKILEEQQKQQAQEASELQMNMMETMEAVEVEKQKHNSTRMESLARLAALETTNAELARSLATTQRNLEVKVQRVADLRQEIELKEVGQEELRWTISNINKKLSTLSQGDHSKGVEFGQEVLEAEYSYVCDKLGQLQDKAKKLEENIEMTRKTLEDPTEVEIELKKRLSQLTDHLIQKQSQVEALSSEKATLLFRIETISRSLDEHGLSLADSASSLEKEDIEAGVWGSSTSRSGPLFQERIRSGGAHIGSILRQLDAIFLAGAVFLRRNRTAQLWSFVYLLCLHIWVMYILLSHSKDSDDNRSGAVVSLESINKTLGA